VSNPGADDNASGTAAVIEAARIISQYDSEYTIKFIAFDMEEEGLVGSYEYVDAHINEDILGMISADMVAYDTGTGACNIYGHTASNPIKNALAAAVTEYSNGLAPDVGGSADASDHAPFEFAGFQACLLIEYLVWSNPYYHTQNDSYDNPNNLNMDYAVKMVRSLVGWLVDEAHVLVPVEGVSFDFPDGLPEFTAPAGGTTVMVDVYGVGGVSHVPGTGMLHFDVGNGWESVPMDLMKGDLYEATFPASDCGTTVKFYFSAEGDDGETYTAPRSAPDEFFTALSAYGMTSFYANMLDSDPGWTMEGDWAFGQPTGQGGAYGGPDPTSGFTGDNVLGYNLYGDYPNNMPQRHLTSDAIDCTGQFGVQLSFYRWLGVEQPQYDHAYVSVSNDGNNWTDVWENAGEIADDEWVEMTLDISAVADDQPTVYLRWTMGTTDGGWTYCGWNVDDIELLALDCESPCAEDINGDQWVNVDDLFALLNAWGSCDDCPEDINDDGIVNVDDLFAVLNAWGPC
jgi:hypothetical protein